MIKQSNICRVLAHLLVSIAASLAIISNAYAETRQTVLRVNTDLFPPYVTHNKAGIEDRLVTEIFAQLGYKIEYSYVPAERGLQNLNEGIDDIILSRVSGLEKLYPNILSFDEHVVEWQFVALAKNPTIQVNNWDSLENYNIAYINGWKVFEQNATRYKSLVKVRNTENLFRLLDLGRVDLVLYALRPAEHFVKTAGYKDIHVLPIPLTVRKKYFYMHKKHKALLMKANDILLEMKRSGRYQKLYNEVSDDQD